MKFVIWCLVVVGIYFLYQATIGNVFRGYQSCYEKAVFAIEQSQGTTSRSNQCVSAKLAYDEMAQCFQTLQKENNLAGVLYDANPTKADVAAAFAAHNEECPAYQLSEPKMTIYLKSGSSL